MNKILSAALAAALLGARASAQIGVIVERKEEPVAASAAEQESLPESEGEPQVETVVKRSKHEVIKANTLWDLAAHYYKDPWKWPRIHEANKDKIKDPHWIYPGQVFVIPGFDQTVQVTRRAPGEAVSVESTPAPPTPQAPAVVPAAPQETGEPDGLSASLPDGQAGQQPAVYRVRERADWKADGEVRDLADRVVMAAQGDMVGVRLGKGVAADKGWRYGVYRAAARLEGQESKGSRYLQRMGTIEIVSKAGERDYKALVVRSGGALEPGDLLKKE